MDFRDILETCYWNSELLATKFYDNKRLMILQAVLIWSQLVIWNREPLCAEIQTFLLLLKQTCLWFVLSSLATIWEDEDKRRFGNCFILQFQIISCKNKPEMAKMKSGGETALFSHVANLSMILSFFCFKNWSKYGKKIHWVRIRRNGLLNIDFYRETT